MQMPLGGEKSRPKPQFCCSTGHHQIGPSDSNKCADLYIKVGYPGPWVSLAVLDHPTPPSLTLSVVAAVLLANIVVDQ